MIRLDRDVTADELSEVLEQPGPPIVLDVRSAAEYAAGHIAGAVNIPFWAVPWRSGELKAPGDAVIVVHCGHGPRAQLARAVLLRQGFTHVVCLAGHMSQWQREARPLVRD
jgi:hydroxyacylglutathione hydrolase